MGTRTLRAGVVRFLFGLLMLVSIHGIAIAFWAAVITMFQMVQWIPLAVGTAVGFLIYVIFLVKYRSFRTFEHELTHAIAATMFFRKVSGFIVKPGEGGYITHSSGFGGWFGDDFIGMAPYVMPTFTLLAALLRPFLNETAFPWYDGLIGFTFAFHVLSTINETKRAWTNRSFRSTWDDNWTKSDIAEVGFLYAAVYIPAVTLFIHGFIFALIGQAYSGVPGWFMQIVSTVLFDIRLILHI